ncbi:MAG TPA: GAF domain-containing protein [Azospirillaceae bacterium]|nr:GAF domain-containing protein [Azospirillaceae bacterium]
MTDKTREARDLLIAATRGSGQPEALLAAAERAFRSLVGLTLFTASAFDPITGDAERIHTTHPGAYPLTGRKPMPDNAWTRRVVVEARPYLMRTPEEIAAVLFDHELIASLGCGSGMNVPVVWDGRALGTVNLFDRAGAYGPEHVDLVNQVAPLVLPALMAKNARKSA